MDTLGVELCTQHKTRIDKLIKRNNTPVEAIQLYYGLKDAGVSPMLEWWDGLKSIDIAVSRVKLNIEVDTDYQMMTHEQAMNNLEEAKNERLLQMIAPVSKEELIKELKSTQETLARLSKSLEKHGP